METTSLPLDPSVMGSLVPGTALPAGQTVQSGPAAGSDFSELVQKLIDGLAAESEADKAKAGQQGPEPGRKEEKTEVKDGSAVVLAQAQCLLGSYEVTAAPHDEAAAGNSVTSLEHALPTVGGDGKTASATVEGVVPAGPMVQPQGSHVRREGATTAPVQPKTAGVAEVPVAAEPVGQAPAQAQPVPAAADAATTPPVAKNAAEKPTSEGQANVPINTGASQVLQGGNRETAEGPAPVSIEANQGPDSNAPTSVAGSEPSTSGAARKIVDEVAQSAQPAQVAQAETTVSPARVVNAALSPQVGEAVRQPLEGGQDTGRRSEGGDPVAAAAKPAVQSTAPQVQAVAATRRASVADEDADAGQNGLDSAHDVGQLETKRAEARKDGGSVESDRSAQWLGTVETKQSPLSPAGNRPVVAEHAVGEKVINQIVRAAKLNSTSSGAGMTLRLDPPHLGVIHMNVASSGGSVTAAIQTSTEAARQVLEADLTTLKQALADAGIAVDSIKVSVGGQPNSGWSLNQGDRGATYQDANPQSARYLPNAVLREFGLGVIMDTGPVSSGRFDYLA